MKRKLFFLSLAITVSSYSFGQNVSRTETKNDAGNQGGASGFFETVSPINYPYAGTNWWHLLDVRHSNPSNNFAMQFTGSFFDQTLYFRKTNNNPATPWQKILMENSQGNVGIGTATPTEKLTIQGGHQGTTLLMHSIGNGTKQGEADLMFWASEPNATWTGVGLGNNINPYNPVTQKPFTLLTPQRGGSYIRLLNNSMLFNVVSESGNDKQALSINTQGNVGIGTTNSDGKLGISGSNPGSEVKIHLTNTSETGYSVIRFSNSEIGHGLAYLHRFNSGWNSGGVPIWEPSSIGFYETVGSMNIGGKKTFKVFTGNEYSERMRITDLGSVGIGTTTPDEMLTVKGKVHAQEVRVDLKGPLADFVFEKYYTGTSTLNENYKMPTLKEVEKFTKENHRLPNIPSAKEIEQNGLQLGEMNNILLQKIEELTLYIIEQQKNMDTQAKELKEIKNQLKIKN